MPVLGTSSGATKGPATAPTIGTATASNGTASVTFTAPSFSKLPITQYTVTASPGGATGTGASSPITVSGLTNGTSYTFTVRATHANGNSPASSASNSVTPAIPTFAMEYLVVGGGASGNGDIHGGGGGAGGITSGTANVYPGTAYSVTAGAGGALNINGTNGSDSTFWTFTGTGGGAGGGRTSPFGENGAAGGCGGGAQSNNSGTVLFYGGTGSQGYAGQDCQSPGDTSGGGSVTGGGGGGMGGRSATMTSGTYSSRAGGIGTNAYSTWASATSSGASGYFSGGGGGSGYSPNPPYGGGLGGGGSGYAEAGGPYYATSGAANTGGGGGGWLLDHGTSGGSGIVIVRVAGTYTAASTTGSPTRYVSGGYTYYKFTGVGSITA